MRLMFTVVVLITGLAMSQVASGQPYPSKPIRLIIPFSPGGGNDLLARAVMPKLGEALGQPIVFDYRPGASGTLGLGLLAKSPNDGYTLGMGGSGPMLISPHLDPKLPFDVFKDFHLVALLATSPYIVTTNVSVPATSIGELIALAKAKPGSINFGSSGTGGLVQLAGELFKSMTGVHMTHVPYKGLGPAITDLLGGHVHVIFADVALVAEHIKSGKLKGLASTGSTRSSAFPDIPTVAEAGVPGYSVTAAYTLLAPSGSPASIVARLSDEIRRILAAPEVKASLVAQGLESVDIPQAQLSDFTRSEYAKWGSVIRKAGIKME